MAELKIKADSGGGTVSFKGPATTTSNAAVQLTLPVDDGTANQYLKTDGSGALSWATVDTSIADNSITGAKIAMGSDAAGDILYYNGTDYIRLAKGTDGQVLKLASGVPTWSDAAPSGLSYATQFQLTANHTGDTDPVTNWGLALETGQGTLGTAVSHSSGIFTFPDEGYWLVMINSQWTTGNSQRFANVVTHATTDNGSNWTVVNRAYGSPGEIHSVNNMHGAHGSTLIDVTDKAQVKIKFSSDLEDTANSNYLAGGTDANYTTCQFIKLGDT